MEGVEAIDVVEMYSRLLIIAQLVAMAIVIVVATIVHRAVLLGRTRGRRAFRCAHARREVEVEFVERRLLGLRFPVAVTRCPVFDDPSAIECARPCLESAFRRRWESALPVVQYPERTTRRAE
jgi:hypothetical protein